MILAVTFTWLLLILTQVLFLKEEKTLYRKKTFKCYNQDTLKVQGATLIRERTGGTSNALFGLCVFI